MRAMSRAFHRRLSAAAAAAALVASASLLAACSQEVPAPTPSRSASSTPDLSNSSPVTPSGSAASTSASSPSGSAAPEVAKIPLSLFVELQRPPIWGVPKKDEWEIVVFDQGGTNQLKNKAGCLITTQQNVGKVEPKDPLVAPTDASSTGDYLETVIRKTRESAKNFELTGAPGSLWLPFGMAKTQEIQLGLVDFTYTRSDTGEPFRTLIASRVMPRSSSQLIANLSCPTGALDAARPMLEGLSILPG